MKNDIQFELICKLITSIDTSSDWFILSRWERNPVKKTIYTAIYEAKNNEYLQILEEVHDKLSR